MDNLRKRMAAAQLEDGVEVAAFSGARDEAECSGAGDKAAVFTGARSRIVVGGGGVMVSRATEERESSWK
jgi:hypothetical protein